MSDFEYRICKYKKIVGQGFYYAIGELYPPDKDGIQRVSDFGTWPIGYTIDEFEHNVSAFLSAIEKDIVILNDYTVVGYEKRERS
jgi:hypothetical protein